MLRTDLIRPLHELLAEHADRLGERTAFSDGRRAVTWPQLWRRTGRLAGHLAALGAERGDRVALLLGNRVETVESYVAVARAGAVGVPLNPHATDAELDHLLTDSGAVVLVTDPVHLDQVLRLRPRHPRLRLVLTGDDPAPEGIRRFEELAGGEPPLPARDDADLDAPAWMLYTSGTTGRPKGVLSTHRRSMWGVAACYAPILGLDGADRVLWPLPLSHTVSHNLGVLGVIAVGATARIMDGLAVDEIIDVLREERSTFVCGVPTLYQHVLEAARDTGLGSSALRVCMVAGSGCSAALHQSFADTLGVRLIDSYGSTETGGPITTNSPTGPRVPGSCGLPVPGLTLRLTDPRTGDEVPTGGEGEVWVDSPAVMLGYHGRPEETAQVLSDGWYRTGDLARRDEAGYLTITGRVKELIIRGGENIHPREVEDVVAAVPGVAEAAVAGQRHDLLGEVPVAFVVPGPQGVDPDLVLATCRRELSYFKVPEQVYEVDRIPRTAIGKVLRPALFDLPARLRLGTGTFHDALLRTEWTPVPPVRDAVPARWTRYGDDDGGPYDVVLLPCLPDAAPGPYPALRRVLDLVDRWFAEEPPAGTRLVVVTRGAVAATADEDVRDVAHAPAWGLLRSVQAAHPDRLVLVDLDPRVCFDPVRVVEAAGSGEPQLALRGDELLAPRLTRVPVTPGGPVELDPEGVVLVTGATTDPGPDLVRHLATRYAARRLLLPVPGGAAHPTAVRLIAELAGHGVELSAPDCAPDDPEALAALLAGLDRPLTAVVAVDDPTAPLAARLAAAAHLHDVVAEQPLRLLVTCSRATGVPGVDGTGEDAAVTAHLDASARNRRAGGQPATSVAWAPWTDRAERGTLSRQQGTALFDVAVAGELDALVAARPELTAPLPGPVPGLLRALVGPRAAAGPDAVLLARRLAAADPTGRTRILVDLVRAEITAVLGLDGTDRVGIDTAFKDLGFDSMSAVRLRDRLSAAVGLRLPATLAFDHPTPDAVVGHLLTELFGTDADEPATAPAATTDEPVAVVAVGCRYPGGVDSAEQLWRLVADESDVLGPFPTDRGWDLGNLFDADPDSAGRSYAAEGGFLYDADLFDAAHFGISPREALATDPQQRLLLECAWEAFERAGIDPTSVKGSRTGVFAGVMFSDYGTRLADRVPDGVEGYLGNGSAGSVASGRIAYSFGLEGPAITVDTACSSSLVALHLAAASLRAGECTLALAGGVTVMSTPAPFVEFSRQRALSPGGRCRAFSATADGTAFAEGAGLVLLERLSDARRNRHPVLAVIRGSAVNSDGASNGLTAPSGPAQQRVIRQALVAAGLTAADVDVVEAHGTGTTLGDPIEAQALLATYGRDRDATAPLWLGSLKSNIGHTQAAAGVGGVIKMVMALRHGLLPRTLHVTEPSGHVDWSAGAVRLLTGARPWPETGRPRRAGVSSFGVSGTNAHLILEQAPPQPDPPAAPPVADPTAVPWLVSAKSEAALHAQLDRLAGAATGLDPGDVAYSLATGRARLPYRAAVPGGDFAGVRTGRVRDGRLAVLFTGQGAQRPGMGDALAAAQPAFAEAYDEVCAALDRHLDRPLREVVRDEPDLLDRTGWTQAALFAFEVALFRLLASWGLHPDAVGGHSVGELTAAHVAGVLSLEHAAELVAARGRLMQALPDDGAMVSVRAGEDEIRALLTDDVDIAAVNGPEAVVIAGDRDAVLRLADQLGRSGRRTRPLRVSHAFHSACMDPMLEDFRKVAERVTFAPPRIPLMSNLTGGFVRPDEVCTADHWVRHVRRTVRFADGVRALHDDGVRVFLEIGPDGVLTALARDCLADVDPDEVAFVAAQRRDLTEPRALATALGELFTSGVELDWAAVCAGPGTRRVDLPTYAFQRKPYWLRARPGADDPAALGQRPVGHALLGAAVRPADTDGLLLTGRLCRQAQPWLADHAMGGTVLFPGTGFVELAVRAGDEVGATVLDELVVEAPLLLPDRAAVRIQVRVDGPDDTGRRPVTVHSCPDDAGAEADSSWTRHASGLLGTVPADPTGVAEPLTVWPPSGAEAVPLDGGYDRLAAGGHGYGPAFQGLRALWRGAGELFAEVVLPGTADGFGLHPALLDAALHADIVAGDPDAGPRLPFSWHDVRLHAAGATTLRVRLRPLADGAVTLHATDPAGAPVVTVGALRTRPAASGPAGGVPAALRDALFHLDWPVVPVPAGDRDRRWAVEDGSSAVTDLPGWPGPRLDGPPPEFVLLPCGSAVTGAVPSAGAVHAATNRVLDRLQRWLADERTGAAQLVVATRGAVRVRPDADVPDLTHAAVWGLVRSAQTENPGRIVLVDLDPAAAAATDRATLRTVAAAVAAGHDQLALRADTVRVPRLARAAGVVSGRPAPPLDPDGVVLVTGGLGQLGRILARHLVDRGARRLLLLGRGGDRTGAGARLAADLAGAGARVDVVACDAADRDALAALLAGLDRPLTAVVHAAGLLDDGVIGSLTPDRLDRVLRPKVDAALHLHELTRDAELAEFVVFSSVGGVLGGPGQGNYAAANAFLDALMGHRQARGLPGRALAWGLWSGPDDDGMAASLSAADRARMARDGMRPLTPAQGVALFDAARELDEAVLVAAAFDPSALPTEPDAVPAPLRGLLRRPVRRTADAAAPVGDLRQRLAGRSGPEQEELLLDLVCREVTTVLGADPGSVSADQLLSDAGFDSLTAVELRNRLGAATALRLPPTLVFDQPSPRRIVGHLRTALAADVPAVGADATASADVDPTETVGALFRDACLAGRTGAGFAFLRGAARLRPTSGSVTDLGGGLTPVRLSTGDDVPLVCLSSYVARGGVHEYVRLAARFRGERTVWALPNPGFAATEPLPADRSAVVDVHSALVAGCAGDQPYVLVGASSGGVLAHDVAARRAAAGHPPAALVLIDTYPPTTVESPLNPFRDALVGGMYDRQDALARMDFPRLTAMTWYFELFEGWRAGPSPVPTLLVRAASPLPSVPAGTDWRTRWPDAATTVDVPGDHFTMLEAHADTTAQAVREWLGARSAR